MYPTPAAMRQGCTCSVVLSSYYLVPVICGVGKISDAESVDVNVRMGWYENYYQKGSYITAQLARSMGMLWTCARSGSTQQNVGYRWVTNGTL